MAQAKQQNVSISVGKAESKRQHEVDLAKIKKHSEVEDYLIEYALSVIAQRDGANREPEATAQHTIEKFQNMEQGYVPSAGSGGGRQLSAREKAYRDRLEEILRNAGWKAQDAKKLAKNPEEAFREFLASEIKRQHGQDATQEQIEQAEAKNWPKLVEEPVQKVLDAQQNVETDLDL